MPLRPPASTTTTTAVTPDQVRVPSDSGSGIATRYAATSTVLISGTGRPPRSDGPERGHRRGTRYGARQRAVAGSSRHRRALGGHLLRVPARRVTLHRPVQELGEVDALAPARIPLLDLGAAGEPVGQHGRRGIRVAESRQEHAFGGGHGDVVVTGLE